MFNTTYADSYWRWFRLSRINESLARKISARNEYDKTIQETEAAYMKVRAMAVQKRGGHTIWCTDPRVFADVVACAEARDGEPQQAGSALSVDNTRL